TRCPGTGCQSAQRVPAPACGSRSASSASPIEVHAARRLALRPGAFTNNLASSALGLLRVGQSLGALIDQSLLVLAELLPRRIAVTQAGPLQRAGHHGFIEALACHIVAAARPGYLLRNGEHLLGFGTRRGLGGVILLRLAQDC